MGNRVITGAVRNPELVSWYQREAMRTAVSPGREGDMDFHFRHAIVGIMTEAGELVDIYKKAAFQERAFDFGKVADELGDICWYLALACHALDIDLAAAEEAFIARAGNQQQFQPEPGTPVMKDVMLVAGAICGWAVFLLPRACMRLPADKQDEQYELDLQQGMPALGNLLQLCAIAAQLVGTDIEAVMRANIQKLRVRFPERFDAARVEDKDEQAERAAVESALA